MLPEKLSSLKDKLNAKEVELTEKKENNNEQEQKPEEGNKEEEKDKKILDKEECICGKMHKTGSKILSDHKNKGRSK